MADRRPSQPMELRLLASETFRLEGDAHKVVTFLNQALKGRGLTFGLSKAGPDMLTLTIYTEEPVVPRARSEPPNDGRSER
ncbi:MAG TPA: DUF4264 family protein [Limnochordia bacterium]